MVHIKIVKIINYLAIAITNQSKEKVGGCGLKVRQKGPKKPSPSLSTPKCTPPYLLVASMIPSPPPASLRLHCRPPPPFHLCRSAPTLLLFARRLAMGGAEQRGWTERRTRPASMDGGSSPLAGGQRAGLPREAWTCGSADGGASERIRWAALYPQADTYRLAYPIFTKIIKIRILRACV